MDPIILGTENKAKIDARLAKLQTYLTEMGITEYEAISVPIGWALGLKHKTTKETISVAELMEQLGDGKIQIQIDKL